MDTDKKVALHFGGDKRLLPRQGSSFFPELAELCTRAGLHGSVSFVILHNYTDLQSREGLHVHTPQVNGVPVSWHSSDKEAVRVLLNGHNGLGKSELHELLSRACGTAKEGKVPKQPETADVLAKILGEENSSQGSEPQETLATTEAEPEEAAPPAEPEVKSPLQSFAYTPSQTTKFFDDSRNIGLFLLEMAVQANSEGELSTTDCVAILRANFGFLSVEYSDTKRRYEYNEPYGVLGRLVSQELLAKSPKLYRLTQKARELLGEKVEPQPEPPTEPVIVQYTPVGSVGDIASAFKALTERILELGRKSEQVFSLNVRRAQIVAEQLRLQNELDEIQAQMEPLAAALQDPSVDEDRAAYEAIAKLFKK